MRWFIPLVFLGLFVTSMAWASEPSPTRPSATAAAPAPADFNSPGPEHARLAALAGRWTTTYHVTPMPGGKVMEIPGSAEFRVTLGGLWLEADTQLNAGGATIAGRLIYGFDRFKKQYVFLFLQQTDTQPLFGYGVPDSSGRVITFTVPMDIPPVNLKAVPVRTVLDVGDGDTMRFEMNTPLGGGKEFQPLRIDYVRAR